MEAAEANGAHDCTGGAVRVLLVADTHLGFDMPLRPRVERVRRGPDFFANFERALRPARRGEVDLVVHGGDLLYRSKVPARLVAMALEPLLELADLGVPVALVPGNHERSAIPYPMLAAHPRLLVFDRPRTFELQLSGTTVALAGLPCVRDGVRDRFAELLEATEWLRSPAAVRLLCLHQAVEGARVGPAGFTFRHSDDVVRGRDIPRGLAAVLAGHIHCSQVLTHDLEGRQLAAPVLYPGAIERTSAAERNEPKGYVTLTLQPDHGGGRIVSKRFHRLPARPWVDLELRVDGAGASDLATHLRSRLAALDPRAVVRLRLHGTPTAAAAGVLSAHSLRHLAGPEMVVSVRPVRR